MRTKISLLSFFAFLALGAFFFLSTPQKANACAVGGCTGTCGIGYGYSGTYCTYYTYSNPACTTGCPTPTPTPVGATPTPTPVGMTPTPVGATPTPTPLVCLVPTVTCSQCVGGVCTGYCAAGSCLTDCSLCGGPTPTPVGATPTPTPGITYTVSGNVFVDTNKDKRLDNGETNYTGGPITVTSVNGSSQPTGTITYPTSGSYLVSGLPAGTYTVSYSSTVPTGYIMTIPINGPPPSFSITVGPGCAATGSLDGACVSDSIQSLNFGISNSIPWVQGGGGGDIRADNGFSSSNNGGVGGGGGGVGGGGGGGGGAGGSTFDNPIPSTANLACSGGAYASVNSGGGSPGVVYTGNGSANFGQGSASVNNWLSGGASYPESFAPGTIGGVIKSSYAYMQSIAQQANVTPVDITSNASYCNFGGLTNCQLSSTLPHGIYIANGNLTISGTGSPSTYTFPANQNYIILVNGDLNIQSQIHVPVGSTVIFSVKGSIYVDKTVGETNYLSTASDLEGIYSADQNFVIQGTSDCTTGADNRINVQGSVIVNAALGGGSFQNQRDLCGNDAFCPVFSITMRPDFVLNLPFFIRKTNYTWQEVAP